MTAPRGLAWLEEEPTGVTLAGLWGEGLLPAAAGLFEVVLLAAPDRLLLEGLPAAAVLGEALLTAAKGLEAAPARRRRTCIISKPTRLYRCVRVVSNLVQNMRVKCLSYRNSLETNLQTIIHSF